MRLDRGAAGAAVARTVCHGAYAAAIRATRTARRAAVPICFCAERLLGSPVLSTTTETIICAVALQIDAR